MSHILVAIITPLSAASMAEPLLSLARRLEAEVTLLHVLTSGGSRPASALETGREIIDDLAGRLAEAGTPCRRETREADEDVTGAVLAAAADSGATLIFMGLSGKSAFARRSGGDIPAQLLARTSLPVLLIPPAAGTI